LAADDSPRGLSSPWPSEQHPIDLGNCRHSTAPRRALLFSVKPTPKVRKAAPQRLLPVAFVVQAAASDPHESVEVRNRQPKTWRSARARAA